MSVAVESGVRPVAARWPRPGHWVALDWAAAVSFTVILRELFGYSLRPASTSAWLGLAVAAALSLPVAVRRRRPAVVLGALLAGSAGLTAAGLPPTTWPLFPAAFVLYLVTATSRVLAGLAALSATIAVLMLVSMAMLVQGRSLHVSAGNVAFSGIAAGFALLGAWATGRAVRQRRAYDQLLRAQQDRQVQAELDRAWRSVTEERLRIARELHDVVAHSMTVIAVHAGVGHHVIDRQPGEARAALGVIETTARQALAEMRRLLGVLRQQDPVPAGPAPGAAGAAGGAAVLPAPGLAGLSELLTQIGQAGIQVRVHIAGQRRDLAAGVDLAVYRIVQEALTNVVRHSGSSSCKLTIGYRDEEIFVEVTDRGRDRQGGTAGPGDAGPGDAGPAGPRGQAEVPGPGHGIIGMRERVSLYGGMFSAGPLSGAGFRVTAVIPVPGP